MTTRPASDSPLVLARSIGALVLAMTACAAFGMMYVTSALIVPGDTAATLERVRASEQLYLLGTLSDLAIVLIEIALTVLLYRLFRPVNETVSLVAAGARGTMTVVQAVNVGLRLTVLPLLGGAGLATSLVGRDALAALLFEMHVGLNRVWVACFALHCALLAWLILRSGLVPRAFGWLMGLATIGYVVDVFVPLFWPAGVEAASALTSAGAFVGELPFFAWLLIKGVDVERFEALDREPPPA